VATFVLVHGAWGSARSWRRLVPILRSRGHDVFAESLTGMGERLHLGGPETNLGTHVQDVVGIIEHHDLRNVALVCHSYGGMVVTAAADRIPERIAHLVYLDAMLPSHGDSCVDMEGGEVLVNMPTEDGWLVVPPRPETPRPSRGHPVGTLTEKVDLTVPLEQRSFTRTYVKAGGSPQPPPDQRTGNFWNAAARVRHDPAWNYVELPFGHPLPIEAPEVLAGLLHQLTTTNGDETTGS
jgi:pimeloyl-ACP methyl ester carboxylesterase